MINRVIVLCEMAQKHKHKTKPTQNVLRLHRDTDLNKHVKENKTWNQPI